jgi:hypothetical protein
MNRNRWHATGLVLVAASALAVPCDCLANRPFPARYDNANNALSVSAGIAALTPTGAGQIYAAGAGGFQLGWYLGRTIFDPPDTVNAGVPVDMNSFLTGHEYPAFSTIAPSGDPTLASLMDASFEHVDRGVALARSVNASLDRYQGALIIGNPLFATARLSEAQSFLAQLKSEATLWAATIPPIIDRFDLVAPGFLDSTFTQTDARSFRDLTVAAMLPTLEPLPWGVYAPSGDEHGDIMSRVSGLTDASINTFFGGASTMTFRTVLSFGSTEIATVMQTTTIVPEPSSATLVAAGVLASFSAARRRRKVSGRRMAHSV